MTKFFYYSKSADKPPGKGANESLDDGDDYTELKQVKNWRKILSNFHIGEFEYNSHRYRTSEHAFQCQKIALADPVKAKSFHMESGSALSKGDGEAARKARKLVVLTDSQLKEWNKIKHKVMQDILKCKFTQSEEAKKVLLLTKTAELWHGTRGVPNSRQWDLERVRNEITNDEPIEQPRKKHKGESTVTSVNTDSEPVEPKRKRKKPEQ
jgi:ribA/ribD-fused uncharacterized protein